MPNKTIRKAHNRNKPKGGRTRVSKHNMNTKKNSLSKGIIESGIKTTYLVSIDDLVKHFDIEPFYEDTIQENFAEWLFNIEIEDQINTYARSGELIRLRVSEIDGKPQVFVAKLEFNEEKGKHTGIKWTPINLRSKSSGKSQKELEKELSSFATGYLSPSTHKLQL